MKKRSIFLILFMVVLGSVVFASGDYESVIYIEDADLALSGWDAVSFFEGDKPKEGDDLYQTDYMNAVWLFSSERNLELFKSNPEKYAPAYGGYCAWAMSDAALAPGKPEHWDIINDKLYLNYSVSTRKKFLADPANLIDSADQNWPAVKSQLGDN